MYLQVALTLSLYKAILLLAWTCLPTATAVNVTIPLHAPRNAPSAAPDLVSLSIEQDRWVDWAGIADQNQFFYNALDNVVQITKSPPFVRIGAVSEDLTNYSFDVEYEDVKFPTPNPTSPYPGLVGMTVGQGFYDIVSHLPFGTRVHWGVNLRQHNLTATYLQTKALVRAFESPAVKKKCITLNLIELGNEADAYPYENNQYNWTAANYVPQWVEFATNVSQTAGLSKTSVTKLIGGSFTGSSHNESHGFSPQLLFANGILDTAPGAFITTISQHRYSGSFCTGSAALLQDLMTKHSIRGNLTVFRSDINATLARGLEYVLGETNSLSCHGAPGVSNTAGAALWAVDYSLFATQVGISRLHFHNGVGYKYNFIQPVTLNRSILDASPIAPLPPHIQPPYYAAIIVAEAIGSTHSTQVVEISVGISDISGYAIFEHGKLARAVFIHLFAYLPGGGVRRTTHIDIDFLGPGQAARQMEVKRLNIPYANATSGITWGGQTYETADARVYGMLQLEKLNTSAGLDIRETEVVLLSFL